MEYFSGFRNFYILAYSRMLCFLDRILKFSANTNKRYLCFICVLASVVLQIPLAGSVESNSVNQHISFPFMIANHTLKVAVTVRAALN